MEFSFAKHETFYIRYGWLYKGLCAVEKNSRIFFEPVKAMDELGLGKNMISSLRYWMQAAHLTIEDYFGNGYKEQKLTGIANIIKEHDEFFEDIGTYWLLHFYLTRKDGESTQFATTWYWFFNIFSYDEFWEDLFIDELKSFIKLSAEKIPADSTLKKDYRTFLQTYLVGGNEDNQISPEDLLRSPFTELKLIKEKEVGKRYYINHPSIDHLDYRIFYYCLTVTVKYLSNESDHLKTRVEDLFSTNDNIVRIFGLTQDLLFRYLDILQEKKLIRLERQAGDYLIYLLDKDSDSVLIDYYTAPNN